MEQDKKSPEETASIFNAMAKAMVIVSPKPKRKKAVKKSKGKKE